MSAAVKLSKGTGSKGAWRWPIILVATVTLAALLLALSWRPWQSQSRALPTVDLQHADPHVAEILRSRLAEVRENPHSSQAWGWLGALLCAYDFRSQGRECLAQAEQLDLNNPRWPYYRGLSLLVATPDAAIPCLQRAAQLCGSNPEAPRFRLDYLLVEQGRWNDAQQALDPLLEIQPRFTPAVILAARIAQAEGQSNKAVELAQSCTEDPRTARTALVLLAELYRQKGDSDKAALALERSTRTPPDEGIADPFQAEVTLMRGDARALSEQAHPLLAAGRLQQAAALVESLEQKYPENPETWLLAGRLALLRKELALAEQHLRRHLTMNPDSAQGLFQLGSVLLAREQWQEAANTFKRATELKPDFGPAFYNRGIALARVGRFRAAVEAFQESLRHNPERLETYLLLADLYLRTGETEAGARMLRQAQVINPEDPRVRALAQRLRASHP